MKKLTKNYAALEALLETSLKRSNSLKSSRKFLNLWISKHLPVLSLPSASKKISLGSSPTTLFTCRLVLISCYIDFSQVARHRNHPSRRGSKRWSLTIILPFKTPKKVLHCCQLQWKRRCKYGIDIELCLLTVMRVWRDFWTRNLQIRMLWWPSCKFQ